jgi:serine phosphatase RsbU (regulator of sigma subunit)
MGAELTITLPGGQVRKYRLSNRPVVIGRDAQCELPIDDPGASRRHARIVPAAEGFLVEDMGSKNGTMVNDQPCRSVLLHDRDRVQIGSTSIMFVSAGAGPLTSVIISEEPSTAHATRYISKDQEIELSQKRLQLLYELSARLTTLQTRESLLENAMDVCAEMLHFERGAIGVRQRDSHLLDWPVVRNLRGAEGELTISRTLLKRALEQGERAIFIDDGGSVDPTVSMVQHGIRSAMCVPLLHHDETLGVIYGDRTTTPTPYSNEDIDFLAAIAQQISIGLTNARLMEDHAAVIRFNQNLDVARRIQTGLFPADLPNRDHLKVAALNDPGQRVSGDYFDVIELPDGRVWCLIADVTGEGIPAALLMANLQAAVRATASDSDDPAALLARWNRLVFQNTDPEIFITAVIALIDPAKRIIRFASAGHHLPLLVRPSRTNIETASVETGFPLGIVDGAEYPVAELALGDEPVTFFIYTDGVIEAMDRTQSTYGSERLESVLAQSTGAPPAALVKQVRRDVTAFVDGAPQSDDITMLAARIG